jgi:hypothetical protein
LCRRKKKERDAVEMVVHGEKKVEKERFLVVFLLYFRFRGFLIINLI